MPVCSAVGENTLERDIIIQDSSIWINLKSVSQG